MEGSMSFFDFLKVLGRGSSGTKPDPVARTFTLETEAGVKAVQELLTTAGYLDPPADGRWGGTSQRALADALNTVDHGLDAPVAAGMPLPEGIQRALRRVTPLPLNVGACTDQFLRRVVTGMLGRAPSFIARGPGYINIVTAEGHDLDGKRNDDRRDQFNDVKMVFTCDAAGVPTLLGSFEATSTPGWTWTRNPMNREGAFNIDPGWQKCWNPGEYHGRALLQVRDVVGTRDYDRKGVRDPRHPARGMFGIYHHQGYNLPRDAMRNASAGCQVIRQTKDQERFMVLVLKEPRYQANHSYVFAATVLLQSDVPERA
jgi:hypothetical protein